MDHNGRRRAPTHDVPVYRARMFWAGAIQVHVTALAETLGRPGRQIRILAKTGLIVEARSMAEVTADTLTYCTFTIERWTTPPRIQLPELRVTNGRVFFIFTSDDSQEAIERTKGFRKLREDELKALDPAQ